MRPRNDITVVMSIGVLSGVSSNRLSRSTACWAGLISLYAILEQTLLGGQYLGVGVPLLARLSYRPIVFVVAISK